MYQMNSAAARQEARLQKRPKLHRRPNSTAENNAHKHEYGWYTKERFYLLPHRQQRPSPIYNISSANLIFRPIISPFSRILLELRLAMQLVVPLNEVLCLFSDRIPQIASISHRTHSCQPTDFHIPEIL